MNSLVKLLVILFCIVPATQSEAEEFKVEWEKTLRPFEFWEQATRGGPEVWPDEKGGCVAALNNAVNASILPLSAGSIFSGVSRLSK